MKSVYCNSNAPYNLTNVNNQSLNYKNNRLLKEHYNDPKYKTELCEKFTKYGKCSYKGKCRYAHGEKELLSRSILNKNYRKQNCVKFSNGFCPYGMRCLYNHKNPESLKFTFSLLLELKCISNSFEFNNRLRCFKNIALIKNELTEFNIKDSHNTSKQYDDLNIFSQNTSSTNLDSRKISQNSFINKEPYLFIEEVK